MLGGGMWRCLVIGLRVLRTQSDAVLLHSELPSSQIICCGRARILDLGATAHQAYSTLFGSVLNLGLLLKIWHVDIDSKRCSTIVLMVSFVEIVSRRNAALKALNSRYLPQLIRFYRSIPR